MKHSLLDVVVHVYDLWRFTMQNNQRSVQKANSIQFYVDELRKESDRGSIIVAVSLLDDTLSKLIKAKLAPSIENRDELFDDYAAPFSTFSSRIDLAYRLGLLRPQTRATFHLLRKIRNNFAHITGASNFNDDSTKNRIYEIYKLNSEIIEIMKKDFDITSSSPTSEPKEINHRLIIELLFASASAYLTDAINDIESIKPLC